MKNRIFERYTEDAKQAIVVAKGEAGQSGCSEISSNHVLLALLTDQEIMNVIGQSVSQIRQFVLIPSLGKEEISAKGDLKLSRQSQQLLAVAEKQAEETPGGYVSKWHLLLAFFLTGDSRTIQLLRASGLSEEDIRAQIARSPNFEDIRRNLNAADGSVASLPTDIDLRRLLVQAIAKVRELVRQGEHRVALRLLDDLMAESASQRTAKIRHLAPLATATARSIGDFHLMKQYCELRLAHDPEDLMALYGMAECLVQQDQLDDARPFIARCYELSAKSRDALGGQVMKLLEERFPKSEHNL